MASSVSGEHSFSSAGITIRKFCNCIKLRLCNALSACCDMNSFSMKLNPAQDSKLDWMMRSPSCQGFFHLESSQLKPYQLSQAYIMEPILMSNPQPIK